MSTKFIRISVRVPLLAVRLAIGILFGTVIGVMCAIASTNVHTMWDAIEAVTIFMVLGAMVSIVFHKLEESC